MLLFRVGLLTLMKMDSLMYLDIWCPSLPIILKLFWLMGWLVSVLSQAGSSQASPENNTLSLAESELSQASSPSSVEDGTLQMESSTPPQAARHSARLRTRQAGTPLGRMTRSRSRTALFLKGYFPRTMLPRN